MQIDTWAAARTSSTGVASVDSRLDLFNERHHQCVLSTRCTIRLETKVLVRGGEIFIHHSITLHQRLVRGGVQRVNARSERRVAQRLSWRSIRDALKRGTHESRMPSAPESSPTDSHTSTLVAVAVFIRTSLHADPAHRPSWALQGVENLVVGEGDRSRRPYKHHDALVHPKALRRPLLIHDEDLTAGVGEQRLERRALRPDESADALLLHQNVVPHVARRRLERADLGAHPLGGERPVASRALEARLGGEGDLLPQLRLAAAVRVVERADAHALRLQRHQLLVQVAAHHPAARHRRWVGHA
mmetsp:Transcript_36223/g.82994  ORF Transcript_36223/g.82994 Transcript_36223/m.82994 type:complete len:302 (-) Transcript_36223:95-1000(-)